VIAYVEYSKLTAGIPEALRMKTAQRSMAETFPVFKIRVIEVSGDGNLGAITVDISASTPPLVIQWLQSVRADAVNIQAKDIFPLLGRDPFSMQLAVAVNSGHFADQLDVVEIRQIFNTLHRLQREAANLKESDTINDLDKLRHGVETPVEREARMVKEMRGQGIDLPEAVDVDWAQKRNDTALAEQQQAQDAWNASHGFAPRNREATPEKPDAFGMYPEL